MSSSSTDDSGSGAGSPNSWLDRSIASFEWTSTALAVVASLILFSITVLVSYSALSRKLLGYSVPGTIQLVEYGLVWATFLAAAWILRRDGHVKVDVLYLVLPDYIVRYIWYAGMILATVATAFMVYFSGIEVYNEYVRGRRLIGQFRVQRWWITNVIPLGFSLLTIEFLIVLLKGPEARNVMGQDKLFNLGQDPEPEKPGTEA